MPACPAGRPELIVGRPPDPERGPTAAGAWPRWRFAAGSAAPVAAVRGPAAPPAARPPRPGADHARGARLRLHQGDDRLTQLRQGRRLLLQRPRSGERQEVVHQSLQPPDLLLHQPGHRLDRVLADVAPIQAPAQDLQLQGGRVERVAHLMGQPGGQRPHRRQPLRPQRPPQHLLLAGHVGADGVTPGLSALGHGHAGPLPAHQQLARRCWSAGGGRRRCRSAPRPACPASGRAESRSPLPAGDSRRRSAHRRRWPAPGPGWPRSPPGAGAPTVPARAAGDRVPARAPPAPAPGGPPRRRSGGENGFRT